MYSYQICRKITKSHKMLSLKKKFGLGEEKKVCKDLFLEKLMRKTLITLKKIISSFTFRNKILKIYKKGIEKCHRDPSFDRISVKQINNRRSIKNHSTVTDQKLTRSIRENNCFSNNLLPKYDSLVSKKFWFL
ncbi:hypothetical protein BpHYR1_009674 [Brachionus plicatilis]|uniref:Uncharacterized protein n=1 Tax=Brachionus plicatilis TaxID=10195 RepID=A0A3M7PXQ1_BRAPC|nr:hypothetical protein BpHYR1_009674 [Brachionus plicatilis]